MKDLDIVPQGDGTASHVLPKHRALEKIAPKTASMVSTGKITVKKGIGLIIP